jgi:hypothetical protein
MGALVTVYSIYLGFHLAGIIFIIGLYLMHVAILVLILQNGLLSCSFRVFKVSAVQNSGKILEHSPHSRATVNWVSGCLPGANFSCGPHNDIIVISIADLSVPLASANEPRLPKQVGGSRHRILRYL